MSAWISATCVAIPLTVPQPWLLHWTNRGSAHLPYMVRPSADLFLETANLPAFHSGEWLHACCSIALSAEPSRTATYSAMTRVRAQNGFVSFDPNIREDLWPNKTLLRECLLQALPLADVVKLSEEERLFISDSEDVPHSMARLAQENGIRLLLVTQGKSGVLAWFNGEIHHYAARPVVSLDTTGARDAFVAGLLWGLAEHGLPHDVTAFTRHLGYAQLCGALATTAKGAMTALLYLEQLQQQLP